MKPAFPYFMLDPFPKFYFCFCPDERSWDKEMSRLGIKQEWDGEAAALCTRLSNTEHGEIVIVQIPEFLERPDDQVLNILVHECVHVFQYLCQFIKEKSPSLEFEAYHIQFIFTQLWAVVSDLKQQYKHLNSM